MSPFSKGIMLTQNKEPALSKKIIKFTNSQPKKFIPEVESPKDIDSLSAKDIISFAKQAEIIDERDGRLLVTKLRRAENNASVIYIDAVDDEPYVSSKLSPLLQFTDEVIFGISLCTRVVGTDNVVIKMYKHIGDTNTTIPNKFGEYSVDKLSGGYPSLPSLFQIKDTGKSETLIIGVNSLIHLTRAVIYNIIQTTTFVTVAGNSVENSMNMEISFGMNFSEILERCGISKPPSKIISGGSMTGFSIIDPYNTIITPTTRAVLAFYSPKHESAYPCISCGRCEKKCPAKLTPKSIYTIMKHKAFAQLPLYDPQYCIRCGTCSYVCPSRLDVAGAVIKAKSFLNKNADKNYDSQEDEDAVTTI